MSSDQTGGHAGGEERGEKQNNHDDGGRIVALVRAGKMEEQTIRVRERSRQFRTVQSSIRSRLQLHNRGEILERHGVHGVVGRKGLVNSC